MDIQVFSLQVMVEKCNLFYFINVLFIYKILYIHTFIYVYILKKMVINYQNLEYLIIDLSIFKAYRFMQVVKMQKIVQFEQESKQPTI